MRMLMYTMILFLLVGSTCFAEIPPADLLERLLSEQSEAVTNFQGSFSMDSEIHYQLEKSQQESIQDLYDRQFEVAVEQGKIYSLVSAVDEAKPFAKYKQSWNGQARYTSSETQGGTLNGVSSKYHIGNHAEVMVTLEQAGLSLNKIFGTYDNKAETQIAKIWSPLMVLERIKKTGSETESVLYEEVDYNGKPHLKMSLVIDKGNMASVAKNPLVEHIMDPDMNYACVESKLYNLEGLESTFTRDYKLGENEELILRNLTISRNVRAYDFYKKYPKNDLDKLACTQAYTFEEYKTNQPINPAVYEEQNVFIIGAETWDYDKKIKIEHSLQDITRETLLSLNQFEDNLGQSESDVAVAVDSKSDSSPEKESERLQEPTKIQENDVYGDKKQPGKLKWPWFSFAIIAVVVLLCVFVKKSKSKNKSTRCLLFILFFMLFSFNNTQAEVLASPEDTKINLGVMDLNTDSIEYEYILTNPLEEDIKILNVKATCSCTVAKFPKVIKPGKPGTIHITVSSKGKLGRISTRVAIVTDKFPYPIKVYLTAYKQNATVTENIMFADTDIAGKLSTSRMNQMRTFTVHVFDNKTEDVGLDNLVYDPNFFTITPMGQLAEKYQVEDNGQRWQYLSKLFSLQIKPKGLGVGKFTQKIYIKNLPIQSVKNSEGKHMVSPLCITATGRIFDKLYTSPSSLTFLVRSGKQLNKKKTFIVFSENTFDYDISYNTERFRLSTTPTGQYIISLSNDCLEEIKSRKSIKDFICFSYIDENKLSKEYKLPVEIISY